LRNEKRRHNRAERSVLFFAVVIVLGGGYSFVQGETDNGILYCAIGLAMITITEWVVWRR
jgi:hypothetical protein